MHILRNIFLPYSGSSIRIFMNWDDLRAFLAVTQRRNLRQAADAGRYTAHNCTSIEAA